MQQYQGYDPYPPPPPPPDYQYPQQYYPQPPRKKRRSGLGAGLTALLVILIVLAILFATPFGDMLMSGLFSKSYYETSHFTVTRTINLFVEGGDINYEMDVPVAEDITSPAGMVQDVIIQVPTPASSKETKFGAVWHTWTGDTSSSVNFDITYEMTVNTRIWDINDESSGYISDIPASLRASQITDEWEYSADRYKIWPSNQQMDSIASDITSSQATVFKNVKSIYDYIRNNVEYDSQPLGEPKDCLTTLRDGLGDCDDQSMLFCSLARAAGIPAWLAFGALYDPVSEEWGAHAWITLFMPLASGGGENVAIDIVNGEFLVRNCNRFEEWQSDGNGEHLEDYYNVLSYDYDSGLNAPYVSIEEEYSGSFEFSGGRVSLFIGQVYQLIPSKPKE
jgi:hypothetical protein